MISLRPSLAAVESQPAVSNIRTQSLKSTSTIDAQIISPVKNKPIKIRTFKIPSLEPSNQVRKTSNLMINARTDEDFRNETDKNSDFSCRFCGKIFENLRLKRRHEIVFCTKDWTKNFNNLSL